MDVCTLCNKEYKNLGSHVRQAHQMGMDEYNTKSPENAKEANDMDILESMNPADEPSGIIITPKEREKGILDVEHRFNENMLVGELLRLKGLTLVELGSIINQFQKGDNTPHPSQVVKKNETFGLEGAKKLADQENPTTTNLHIAEALVKKLGFEVAKLTRNPKTWHLTKPRT